MERTDLVEVESEDALLEIKNCNSVARYPWDSALFDSGSIWEH